MNTYNIAGRQLAIVDGELYERLQAVGEPVVIRPSEVKAARAARRGRPRTGRTPGSEKKLSTRITDFQARKARKRLGPEAEEAIIDEIKSGAGVTEICKKYEISVATYYRLKGESKSKPVIED